LARPHAFPQAAAVIGLEKPPKHEKIVAARAQTVTWITAAPGPALYPQ
jgi:hypothetical protein